MEEVKLNLKCSESTSAFSESFCVCVYMRIKIDLTQPQFTHWKYLTMFQRTSKSVFILTRVYQPLLHLQ